MTDINSIKEIVFIDLKIAFSLLTRIPINNDPSITETRLAIASWAFPLVGAILGLIIGILSFILLSIGTPPYMVAIVALAGLIILTGGMHEDGLADCADGFGGGYDKKRRLEIMKDSHIGSFGAIALILFLSGRVYAVDSLFEGPYFCALIAIGAISRLPMVYALWLMPNARGSGLSSTVGKAPEKSLIIALLMTMIISFLCLGISGFVVFGWAMVFAGIMAWIAYKMIGGQTGDVLGALQQWAELAALGAALTLLN